jgi:PAS domain-containing protein
MKIHLKLLTERYWFRLGLSLCFAITAALSYADRDFIWMGLSLCLLLFSIWWQLSLYRIHTKRVLFMIDALENNDSAIHFPEEQIMPETREVNRALNRVGRILYNVKSETVQQEKYYELIMDCINTGVLVLNENGAVYQKNNEALRLLGLNVFTHIRQLNKVDIQLMKKIEFCRPGDKIQTIFNNERGAINLSIRVSGITVREEQLRILAFNDINSELDEKEIDSWIRLTRVLTHEIMNSVTPITSLSETLLAKSDFRRHTQSDQQEQYLYGMLCCHICFDGVPALPFGQ